MPHPRPTPQRSAPPAWSAARRALARVGWRRAASRRAGARMERGARAEAMTLARPARLASVLLRAHVAVALRHLHAGRVHTTRLVERVLGRPAGRPAPARLELAGRAATAAAERAARRGRRVEHVVAGAARAPDTVNAAAAVSAPAAALVPRVVRRPPPAPASDPARGDDGWGAPIGARVAPAAAHPFGAVELDRIAEHVMHTIDRRVGAYRERRGRV